MASNEAEDRFGEILVLHLEDSDLDVDLVRRRLQQSGLRFRLDRVSNRADFLDRLATRKYDMLLSDYQVPGFDGLDALTLAQEHQPDTPFLFVSGVMGEEVAVDALQRGATDYVLKQKLVRLGAAVERALAEARERAKHRAAERALEEQRQLLETTFASIGDAVITADTAGNIRDLNRVAETLTGWRKEQAVGLPLTDVFQIVDEHSRQPVENPVARVLREGAIVGLANHTILISKDGTERPIDDSAAPIRDAQDSVTGAVLTFRDVTERRRLEREEKQYAERLRESEQRYRLVSDAANDAIWDWDLVSDQVTWSESMQTRFGYSAEQVGSDSRWWASHIHPEDRERVVQGIRAAIGGSQELWQDEYRYRRADGAYAHVFDRGRIVHDRDGQPLRMVGSMLDLTEQKRAEQRLREQEQQYRSIFESTSDAVLVFDYAGRLIEANPAGCSMHGYSRQEFLGLHGTAFVHADDHHKFADFVRKITAGEEFHVDSTHVRKDGELVSVQFTGTSFTFGGRPALLAVVRDVTEQKKAIAALRKSEQRLRFIMDSMPQKIFTATPSGDVDYFNPTWIEFTGLSAPVILDWGWTQFIHPDDVEENVRRWKESVQSGEPFQLEHRFRTATGEYRWHITRAVSMQDDAGEIAMWIGSSTEIHDVKSLQEELRQAAARLSEADRRKDECLATLAHELRNPLAPIRTGLELMKMAGDDPTVWEDARSTMERQTQQLVALVDDLLEVSRITRGKLELRKSRVRFADVVRSAVEASQPFIDEAGHELTVSIDDADVEVHVDPYRLAQVLSNLLTNATKYTPDGGRVRLAASRQGGEIVISVADNGIGIPSEMLEQIFQMFTQVERPMEKGYSGLGIGLTLVKSLVTMHGGQIEAKSDGPNRGSEFVVRLPIFDPVPEAESRGARSVRSAAVKLRRRVLVVDDNQAATKTLGKVVQMLGHDVRTAEDGKRAIEAAAEFQPEVVLMDIGMPNMNGYEAARRMRQFPWGKNILLVALTGWGQPEDKQRTKAAGFDHHLVKPVEADTLRTLFRELDQVAAPSESMS